MITYAPAILCVEVFRNNPALGWQVGFADGTGVYLSVQGGQGTIEH